jgi:ubiquinone/menaquinone biosynthesis C-methylase UbiE
MQEVTRSPRFGLNAVGYEKFRPKYPEKIYKTFFKVAPPGKISVLDLACGTGRSTFQLVRARTEVTACDPDRAMLNVARQAARRARKKVTFVECRAEKMPFNDRQFDAITIGTAVHWFKNKRAMREIRRVLMPGGLIFLFTTVHLRHRFTKEQAPATFKELFAGLSFGPKKVKQTIQIQRRILREAHFKKVRSVTFPTSGRATKAKQLGYYQTMSWFIKLPAREKKVFLKRAQGFLKERLGKSKYFLVQREARIVYGYK